jgi:hypothetical protein
VAPGEHHVVGFEVAVHHPVLVRVGQGIDDLADEPDRIVDREFPAAGEPIPQRFALHVRHHVVEEPVGLA